MLGSRRPRLKPRGGQIRLGGQQDGLVRIEDRIVQTDQLRSRRIKKRRLEPPSRKEGGERVPIGGHLPQLGGRDVGNAVQPPPSGVVARKRAGEGKSDGHSVNFAGVYINKTQRQE